MPSPTCGDHCGGVQARGPGVCQTERGRGGTLLVAGSAKGGQRDETSVALLNTTLKYWELPTENQLGICLPAIVES